MEIRQLEYFVAVAEEKSFTKAAAKLHVAQPGVSTQIRQLERELGQELLDRTGRTVRLTEVGAAVLTRARAALAALAAVRQAVDEHTGLLRGRVSVGMVASSAAAYDLPRLLADFHREHPAIEITLSESTSDLLLTDLREGRFDAVAVSPSAPLPPGIDSLTVADEPLVAAVAHDHPLAHRTSLRLAELRDEPLIVFHPSVGARHTVEDACSEAGFPPRIAFEASDPNLLADLAVRGLGVAVLPAPFAAARPEALRTVALTDPPMRGAIVFAWRGTGTTNPAAGALIRHLRSSVGTVGSVGSVGNTVPPARP
ncbi:LysR family transcriptional regulator [Streptomyces huiliensis]|uniref:LysR family transcriptional regulator n=1 Tax=Streptomyces huiliensis TaxID=2876027 RepID=UPI001CBCBD6D|nr:LysR family transcriptional regulator [Streptomyces huiliensis]MBZ4318521.1 LysR family transcriptional regulator [Streptomyces huiliensis]